MEKAYSKKAHINKMHRLILALEEGNDFTIQIKGKHIRVPADADVSIEFEKDDGTNELEFQMTWKE